MTSSMSAIVRLGNFLGIGLAALACLVSASATAADSVSVTPTTPVASESGPTPGVFTITRNGSTGTLTVLFTMGGTATSGSDYVPVSPLSVSFVQGETSKTVVITPIDDGAIELRESVTITISPDPSYIVGASPSAQLTIADNDLSASVVVADSQADEDVSLFGTTIDPQLQRRGVSAVHFSAPTPGIAKNVAVRFSGNATFGSDYAAYYKVGPDTSRFGTSASDFGTGVGYATDGAAYATGVTSIDVVGSTGINDGDLFSIAGDSNTYLATNTLAGSGTLTFVRFISTTGGSGLGVAIPASSSGAPGVAISTKFPVSSTQPQILVPPKGTMIQFSVEPVADGIAEGHESVIMTLLGSQDYRIDNPTVGTVLIADRDAIVDVTLGSNAGKPSTTGFFTITLDQAFTVPITIPYTVSPSGAGVAVPDVDYVALTGSIDVPAGATSVAIPVTPLNTAPLGITSVTITLQDTLDYKLAGSGSSSSNPSATVNITDSLGSVSIIASTPTAIEHPITPTAGVFTVSIARNPSGVGALSVNYTVTGSATSGSRYTALTGTVQIPGSSNNAQIVVNPIEDFITEGNESVIVTLNQGQGYAVNSSAQQATVIITEAGTGTSGTGGKPTPGTITTSKSSGCGSGLTSVAILVCAILGLQLTWPSKRR